MKESLLKEFNQHMATALKDFHSEISAGEVRDLFQSEYRARIPKALIEYVRGLPNAQFLMLYDALLIPRPGVPVEKPKFVADSTTKKPLDLKVPGTKKWGEK